MHTYFFINNIIIEPDRVRGIDDDSSVVMLHETDVPLLPFTSIGLNRIDVFISRFDIAASADNFEVEAIVAEPKTSTNGEPQLPFARALMMQSKGIQIDYRCANPKTIRAPKGINDTMTHSVDINPETVALISKGQAAMSADTVNFVSDEDGVSFQMTDINGDVFKYQFAPPPTPINKGKNDPFFFSYSYPSKTVLSLLKESPNTPFLVGSKMMSVVVNGLNIFILPRAQ